MQRTLSDLTISAFGLATSLLVVSFCAVIQVFWEVPIYAYFAWGIVPIGAIALGLLGAAGYYVGAVLTHAKPTNMLLLNTAVIGVGTYLTLQYFAYFFTTVDGTPIAAVMSFWEFLDIRIRSTTLGLATSPFHTASLGVAGYAFALLQVLGFAAGGAVVYWQLLYKPFCGKCERYFRKVWRQTRYTVGDETTRILDVVVPAVCELSVATAKTLHATCGRASRKTKEIERGVLILQRCPVCADERLSFEFQLYNDRYWQTLDDASVSVLIPAENAS